MSQLEEEQPPVTVQRIATCRTEGCPSQGVQFPVEVPQLPDGQLCRVVCGRCGNDITDLTEVPAG